jgi:hypothetical protein
MKSWRSMACGVMLAVCGSAMGQQDVTQPHDHGAHAAGAAAQPGVTVNPKFDQMVRRGADGKVERLHGFLDVIGLHLCPEIDAAAWEKALPMIDEWVYDTDRSVIDNLDFIEEFDGGVLNKLDLLDANMNRRVMEMEMQFIAIGPLTAYLEVKGALTRAQSQSATNIVNEYHQQVMNELRDAAQKEFAALPEEERTNKVTHVTSRFIFELMARDAMASYERQLDELAPNFAKIVSGMKLDPKVKATVDRATGSLKDAAPGEERRKVVKAGLAALSFDQRRSVLTRARELAPKFDARTAYADVVAKLKASAK